MPCGVYLDVVMSDAATLIMDGLSAHKTSLSMLSPICIQSGSGVFSKDYSRLTAWIWSCGFTNGFDRKMCHVSSQSGFSLFEYMLRS